MCIYARTHTPLCVCGGQRTVCRESNFSFYHVGPGDKLRSSGSAATIFICWAISMPPYSTFLWSSFVWYILSVAVLSSVAFLPRTLHLPPSCPEYSSSNTNKAHSSLRTLLKCHLTRKASLVCYHGLNVFPLPIYMLKNKSPNGLWKVNRIRWENESGGPKMGLVAL